MATAERKNSLFKGRALQQNQAQEGEAVCRSWMLKVQEKANKYF